MLFLMFRLPYCNDCLYERLRIKLRNEIIQLSTKIDEQFQTRFLTFTLGNELHMHMPELN